MTKVYLYSLFLYLVLLLSCKSQTNKNEANLRVDSLQYSAYRWRTNEQTSDYELFLAYYIKIDKAGNYLAMRHNMTPEPAMYFRGKIDSSVHNLLDSLAIVSLETFYIEPGHGRIYDGNTFRLNFVIDREQDIHFYHIDAPLYLQRLASSLDTIIFKSNKTTEQFDLSSHEQELKVQSLQRLGGLPRQEAPKFK